MSDGFDFGEFADSVDGDIDPAAGFRQKWRSQARPEQQPPPGDNWRTLYLQGGRGGGKTWAGAHILAEWILEDPEPGEWGIVAPTYQDAWSTCVEGPSGLLAALGTTVTEVRDGQSKLVEHWHRSFAEIRLRNGHLIRVASAQDGGLRIQGKNLKGCWCDEIGLWDNWDTTWNESIKFAVREGSARIVATGTPKQSRAAKKLIKLLLTDPSTAVQRLRTIDNAPNLAPRFLAEVVGKASGTRLERQELEGLLLEDVEGALWTGDMIDAARVKTAPADLLRVVVAIDPAVTNEEGSDETGIMVVGEAEGGHGFVLEDGSMRGTPDACMRRAVALYHKWQADRIVGEANNGGDFIGSLLRTVDANVPYAKVIATRGKRVRAEPVSALYEQLRVHHVGHFTDLEEQMVSWVPSDPGDSPDRVDALVWACAELKGLSQGSFLEAYGVARCRTCELVYAERYGGCTHCHPELLRQFQQQAPPRQVNAQAEPEPMVGWGAAYGGVKCPGGHTYIGRVHPDGCPKCTGGGTGQRGAFPALPFAMGRR
jgi:phage terminase large subunit-like protein